MYRLTALIFRDVMKTKPGLYSVSVSSVSYRSCCLGLIIKEIVNRNSNTVNAGQRVPLLPVIHSHSFPSRCCGSWGTRTSTVRRRTCLGTTSSRGACRLQGCGTRSWLRWSTRFGGTAMATTQRGGGCCCWRASAALPPRRGWTSIS